MASGLVDVDGLELTIGSFPVDVVYPGVPVDGERISRIRILDHADLIMVVDEEAQLLQVRLKHRVWRKSIWTTSKHFLQIPLSRACVL